MRTKILEILNKHYINIAGTKICLSSKSTDEIEEMAKELNDLFALRGVGKSFDAFFDENHECIVDNVYRAKVIEHNEPTFLIEYYHNGQTDKVQTSRVKRPKSV